MRILILALLALIALGATALAEDVWIVRNLEYDDTGMLYEDGMLRLLFCFDDSILGPLPDDASTIRDTNWQQMVNEKGTEAAVIEMLAIDIDMR